jgi:hypothetical protein
MGTGNEYFFFGFFVNGVLNLTFFFIWQGASRISPRPQISQKAATEPSAW